MKKADFKKWFDKEMENSQSSFPSFKGWQLDFINRFAIDFAEKEAIEFLKWDDRDSGIVRHLIDYNEKYKAYQKFKDES